MFLRLVLFDWRLEIIYEVVGKYNVKREIVAEMTIHFRFRGKCNSTSFFKKIIERLLKFPLSCEYMCVNQNRKINVCMGNVWEKNFGEPHSRLSTT